MCRTLGATDPFFDAAATTLHYPFHEIHETVYEQAFQQQKLSVTARGRAIAQTLQVCMQPSWHAAAKADTAPASLLYSTATNIRTLQQRDLATMLPALHINSCLVWHTFSRSLTCGPCCCVVLCCGSSG
jgi:hypothetical protein